MLALWKAVVKMTIMPSRVMRQRRYLDLVLEENVQELQPIALRQSFYRHSHCLIFVGLDLNRKLIKDIISAVFF